MQIRFYILNFTSLLDYILHRERTMKVFLKFLAYFTCRKKKELGAYEVA